MDLLSIDVPDYVKADIAPRVATALAEDVGSGDINALLMPEAQNATAAVVCREKAVICGIPWFNEVFRQLDPEIRIDWQVHDGDEVHADTRLCRMNGACRSILTGERTALNFLQTLSGTATRAREFSDAARQAGNIRVLDTRKTLPGLRTAQKYAVLRGGCENHRLGLFDEFLIKENHIASAGDIATAIIRARELAPEKKLTIEVESLEEMRQALEAGPDRIMLDDFNQEDTARALEEIPKAIEIEISGNQNLDSLGRHHFRREIFVSVGALTKHVRAIDLSLRLDFRGTS